MRIGWRQLVKNLMVKPSGYHALGIEFSAEGLHISVFEWQDNQPVWMMQHFIEQQNWEKNLKSWVAETSLQNTPLYASLSLERYKILQVDRPAVPDEEMVQALRWSVKDLIGSQEELVLDYFDLPAQTMSASKINVVAIPKSEITEIIRGVKKAALVLENISIEELATCNLRQPEEEAVMHVVQSVGREVCLIIVKDGKLYFSRRLKGYEKLRSFSEEELRMGMGDNLSIEIQRSMDYFEGQLRQAGVKKILLAMDTTHTSVLAELVRQLTLLEVDEFVPQVNKSDDMIFDGNSFNSVGAVLGKDMAFAEANS